MSVKNLVGFLREDFVSSIHTQLQNKHISTISGSGNPSSKAFLLSLLLQQTNNRKIFWIVNNTIEAQEIKAGFLHWFTPREIVFLSNIFQEDTHPGRIAKLIGQLKTPQRQIFILTQEDFLAPFPTPREVEKNKFTLAVDGLFDLIYLVNVLIDMGYTEAFEPHLKPGEFLRTGNVLSAFSFDATAPVKIEFDGEQIANIFPLDIDQQKILTPIQKTSLLPAQFFNPAGNLQDFFTQDVLVVSDELDENNETPPTQIKTENFFHLHLTSFPGENQEHHYLRFLSVLKYQTVLDFITDIKEKIIQGWQVVLSTRRTRELKNILHDKGVSFSDLIEAVKNKPIPDKGLFLLDCRSQRNFPPAFQNPRLKTIFLTDNEIFGFYKGGKSVTREKAYLDFIASLKPSDFVVHIDHGIGRFLNIEQHTIDSITREYLKIGYAENDKLYVPIDQADKISKFIGLGDTEPRLTRLGSTEWSSVTSKAKKETQKIAKELLILFAKREAAVGFKCNSDTTDQKLFEQSFPYEETPGQLKAIIDTKHDMESGKPMDRLICGDVGFGKTEVAMRAAFKAVQNKKQVAMISPITILADQHYRTFRKRMDEFHVRVEMLSRFRTQKEQTDILKKLGRGEIDIIIGTHRLLQPDVQFKNLSLVIVDEEQRFGVKQKEKLKSMRASVDILTLTATPIPRTLNMSLHNLRDITTITTPPPGRLPIITEVRHFSLNLIRETILYEKKRNGQIYFLHNRVQTIDTIAERLRDLIPEVSFCVAHGQLDAGDLEARIIDFKNHKFDVLISSTIIENGIDLANANTLIVDNAEEFGLSQLYQLRGRVGRGKTQAYAYFLYHTKRLKPDAKKRLRAIIEASELGSGFQIAMRDLEIRGAGDILGAKQHGTINVVGVNHFIRLLHKAVEDLKAGKPEETAEHIEPAVTIEIPLTAYIPDHFITDTKEKIKIYQKLSSLDKLNILDEYRLELIAEFGELSKEVINLFKVLHLKILAKKALLTNVKVVNLNHTEKEVELLMSSRQTPAQIVKVLEYNPKWTISGSKLKINLKDLGFNWFEELRHSIEILGDKDKTKPSAKKISST